MVDEQAFAARLGMGADHRVAAAGFAPGAVGPHRGRPFAARHRRVGAGHFAVAVDAFQPGEQGFHALGQPFVGEILIGEQGVAAIGRHVEGVEQGAHRRFGHHGGVGVPFLADDLGVAGIAGDRHHLRVMVAGVEIGMDENIAKGAGQALVSGDVELLVAEKDHTMVQKRGADFRDYRIGQRHR